MWLQNCLLCYTVSFTSALLSLTSCNAVFVSFPWGIRPSSGAAPPTILASCWFLRVVWPVYSMCTYITYVPTRWMELVGRNGEYIKQFSKIKLKGKRTLAWPRLFKRGSGGVVVWGTALHSWMSRVRFPMVSLEFFIDIILPALRSTQPLTEMSTRNFLGG
jgi:hypothetical protein